MTDEHVDVVIVGAGPNGLMLASELALAGLRPVVLDVLTGPSDEPKSNGLVGQIIRQLDMRGLYKAFGGGEDPPRPVPGWVFAGMQLSFVGIKSNSMYVLPMQQPQLVRLLEKRARELGVDIRWGHEFTALDPGGESVAVSVQSAQRNYRIDADYLVGSDGGRSIVRRCIGIGFPGYTSPIISRLGNVRIPERFLVPGRGYEIAGFGLIPFGPSRFSGGSLFVLPIAPEQPLVGTMEYGSTIGSVEGPMTFDELRDSIRRILGVDMPVEAPKKPGPQMLRRLDGINTRQADRYRVGRVMLLGDAAHVHAPIGGPGLNLAMQDAVNLGWKLAAVVKGQAPESLLDTYESERYPVGERVMMHSKAQLALAAPGPEVDALRELFEELSRKEEVPEHLAGLLAGSDVRYDIGDDHPLSGLMVPDLVFDDGRRVADLLHEAHPVLLDLSDGAAAGVAASWADRVDIVSASTANRVADALLIRPDGYVAWAADAFTTDDEQRLQVALRRWFGPGGP